MIKPKYCKKYLQSLLEQSVVDHDLISFKILLFDVVFFVSEGKRFQMFGRDNEVVSVPYSTFPVLKIALLPELIMRINNSDK